MAEQGGQGRAGRLGGAEVGEERVIEAAGVDVVGDAHHADGHAL